MLFEFQKLSHDGTPITSQNFKTVLWIAVPENPDTRIQLILLTKIFGRLQNQNPECKQTTIECYTRWPPLCLDKPRVGLSLGKQKFLRTTKNAWWKHMLPAFLFWFFVFHLLIRQTYSFDKPTHSTNLLIRQTYSFDKPPHSANDIILWKHRNESF